MIVVKKETVDAVETALSEIEMKELCEKAIAAYTGLPVQEVRAALYAIGPKTFKAHRGHDSTPSNHAVVDFIKDYVVLPYPFI